MGEAGREKDSVGATLPAEPGHVCTGLGGFECNPGCKRSLCCLCERGSQFGCISHRLSRGGEGFLFLVHVKVCLRGWETQRTLLIITDGFG